jgi:pyridoxine 5-phosphate synthase
VAASQTKLSVNVNKIATLRNTRPKLNIPDLVRLSELAIQAGAAGLTIHPRPDQRHIRDDDVDAIADLLKRHSAIEFNIEGNPFEGRYMEHCHRTRPQQCTLVPDSGAQNTSDHGWNLPDDIDRLRPIVRELQSIGCRVSLFMDPNVEAIRLLTHTGADRVELYTEPYAAWYERQAGFIGIIDYTRSAIAAHQAGLHINAGHDLNLENLGYFVQHVPNVAEVSIGHALIADAIEFGLAETVRKYSRILLGKSAQGSIVV